MPGWFLFETCCQQYIFEEILLMSMPKYEDGIKTCDWIYRKICLSKTGISKLAIVLFSTRIT